MSITANYIYSDLHRDAWQATEMLAFDIEDIYMSIWNILTTNKGERLFLPEFGADLESLLFELMSEETAFVIWTKVTDSITRWDSRISLDIGQCTVEPDYDNNGYELLLVFMVEGLSDQSFDFKATLSTN